MSQRTTILHILASLLDWHWQRHGLLSTSGPRSARILWSGEGAKHLLARRVFPLALYKDYLVDLGYLIGDIVKANIDHRLDQLVSFITCSR